MFIFDLEADGLLQSVTKIHVLVAHDTETNKTHTLVGHESIEPFIRRHFMSGPEAVPMCGHNILGYDLPALSKVFPWFTPHDQVFDTLVAARLVFPPGDGSPLVEKDLDRKEAGKLPGSLIGSHSLEAWGYRLGDYKGDFTGPWEVCTPEMVSYCQQDVKVTTKLYRHILKQEPSAQALQLEHDVQRIIQRQVRRGVLFDSRKAEQLYVVLTDRKAQLESDLKKTFGSWFEMDGKEPFVPKKDDRIRGYTKGCAFSKLKLVEFNPGSRQHIAKRLTALYGWKPRETTESGQAKVDEKVLSKLTYPTIPLLLDYLMVDKRLGQLMDGQNGWLKLVTPAGRIHGDVNTGGAVTGRMTHSRPNLAQVPASGSPFGKECRELFVVPAGFKLVGCDASGLELRMLAHFMGRYDGGAYGEVVVNGKKEDGTDIHTVNQKAAGLPTRDDAKTFIYAFLYGAGDAKIGSIIKGSAETGKRLKERFLAGLPALGALKDALDEAAKKGHILGLDKRRLFIRSAHAALNTLLQSAGALVMKQALVILDRSLQAQGLVPGVDYEFVLNIHDEFQIEVLEAHAAFVAELAKWSIAEAGRVFNLRCPLEGDASIGNNWAETH